MRLALEGFHAIPVLDRWQPLRRNASRMTGNATRSKFLLNFTCIKYLMMMELWSHEATAMDVLNLEPRLVNAGVRFVAGTGQYRG